MLFAIWAPDKPNNLEKRMEVRPRHLDYWGNMDLRVILAGPMLDEETGDLQGSMLIVEADDIETVRARAEADPYWTDGVFEQMVIKPVRLPLGDLAESI
jgi:uncharacterized protein YciI